MRRVVITGLGVVSPHGLGIAATWDALLEAKSSIGPLALFDASAFPCRIAGNAPPFKTTDYVPKSYRKATKIMARDIQLAVTAADLAVRDAKLATKSVLEASPAEKIAGWSQVNPTRMGCNIGAGLICTDLDELSEAMIHARNPDGSLNLTEWGRSDDPNNKPSGMDRLTPLWMLKYLPNMLACHVSILHDTQGPSNTITCGHASGGLALGEACRSIQRGAADLALIGGCEAKVNPMALARLTLLNHLAEGHNDDPAHANRPLDRDADGMIIADGGGVLVIEELEHAKKRGATIYCEIVGLGGASYGGPILTDNPDPHTSAVGMQKSLRDAGIGPELVQLIVPMGSAVPSMDRAEAASIREVFDTALKNISVVPMRGGIGDCGAGSQAMDLALAAKAIHQQFIPPATNCPNPINNMPVPQAKRSAAIDYAVVTATSFGGQTSSVVLKKYTDW
jgi:3-oxoacyl-[acyl-carrier-protein] synthase II